MTCPKCRGAMQSKLIVVDTGGWWSGSRLGSIEIDLCGACGGAWFDGGEWTAYLERRVESMPKPAALTPANHKLIDARVATCPRCSVSLERKKRGQMIVDLCGTCNGLWLDGGEYPIDQRTTWEARLIRLARG